MKRIIILGDGMADEPLEALGGKTPLEYARTPNMDMLAKLGVNGTLETVPQGFAPGSEIANMTLLGYDVENEFEGRGSLEAASIGVDLEAGDMALRCNLITISNGLIKNHSAGHISTEEAGVLIDFLNDKLANDKIRFYKGVAYRHLLVIAGGDKRVICTPPHDVPGTPFSDVMIKATDGAAGQTAEVLNSLILRSQKLLESHPVNIERIKSGRDPANSIWPWSPGYRPAMKSIPDKFPWIGSGSVISAVDLIKGIGVYAGLESIEVEGATGLYDTNYEGKAAAAIEELRRKDFVFLHIEASDEASHEGDIALKIKTIEDLDRRVVGPLFEAVKNFDDAVSIAVLPDHPTYCRLKTHVRECVPFLIYNRDLEPDSVMQYNERAARNGSLGSLKGSEFIELFLKQGI